MDFEFPEFDPAELPPGVPVIAFVPGPETRLAPGPVIGAASGPEARGVRDPEAAEDLDAVFQRTQLNASAGIAA